MQRGCRGRCELFGASQRLLNDARPILCVGDGGYEAEFQRLIRAEGTRCRQYGARVIGANAVRKPLCAEHYAKLKPRHAKRSFWRGDAHAAGCDQIGACADIFSMLERQRFEWRVVERLQQRFDANEAQRQIAFTLFVTAAEIKAGAEMFTHAFEYQ